MLFRSKKDKAHIQNKTVRNIFTPRDLTFRACFAPVSYTHLKAGTYNDNDPIGVLDVTISSNLILDEVLGIKALRSDKRIDFVGGIR